MVFLTSCLSNSNVEQSPKIITGEAVAQPKELVEEDKPRTLVREEDILRERYGLFDFSELTVENCKDEQNEFEFKIIKHREDIEDSKETLETKQDQYERKLEIYNSLRDSTDEKAKENAKEDMEEALMQLEQIEDQVEEAEDYLKRMEFTLTEIKRECKELATTS